MLEKVAGVFNHGYGFVWGLSDSTNFSEFVISDSGYYQISRYDNGSATKYVAWKSCSEIRGSNTVNVLEIRRNDDIVEFYINSVLLEKLAADTVMQVSDHKIGLIIYDKIKIKVHSLIISAEECETSSYIVNQSDDATKAFFLQHEPPVNDTLEKRIR